MKFLDSNEYPKYDNWQPLDYNEWVQRSFITSLLKPEAFNRIFQDLIVKNTEEWIKNSLIVNKTIIPGFRLIHHFSGQLTKTNKIICFGLNPKAGVHIVDEFKRILFTLPNYYDLEKRNIGSSEINARLDSLMNNPEKQYNIAEFFWNDENDRFSIMTSLIDVYRRKGISVGNLWGSYKKIFSTILNIKNITPEKNSKLWIQAHDHLVIIDLIPYFTNAWNFPINNELVPYLDQMLKSLLDTPASNKTLIFFGADYIDLFRRAFKTYGGEFMWRMNQEIPKKARNTEIYSKEFNLTHKIEHEKEFQVFFLPFPRQNTAPEYIGNIRDSIG